MTLASRHPRQVVLRHSLRDHNKLLANYHKGKDCMWTENIFVPKASPIVTPEVLADSVSIGPPEINAIATLNIGNVSRSASKLITNFYQNIGNDSVSLPPTRATSLVLGGSQHGILNEVRMVSFNSMLAHPSSDKICITLPEGANCESMVGIVDQKLQAQDPAITSLCGKASNSQSPGVLRTLEYMKSVVKSSKISNFLPHESSKCCHQDSAIKSPARLHVQQEDSCPCSEYLSTSSLMFFHYSLPDLPVNATVRGRASRERAGYSKDRVILLSDIGVALAETDIPPGESFNLDDDSIFQSIPVNKSSRSISHNLEASQGFIISEAMNALIGILSSVLISLLTKILHALVPKGKSQDVASKAESLNKISISIAQKASLTQWLAFAQVFQAIQTPLTYLSVRRSKK
ncbi:hypothetical protein NDU88_004231 [Pleurodeles waltl]|uniref:Uncharacterized protein n=1 Tax=Pleurodeles waltl TaxID=8319 RepID=A0AAV7TQQ7_PLEWA|nr:hypothetical protein NDU88_004231 [Pleurodeles waltl]